ncbi:phage head spike fiber domain-containing protein, partial [Aeromonas caviae]|uniref:phage head spike fiber domain-containing protein n=1 Tax=Aeromonas caviae TaxID=648 RepID=UPI001CC41FF8
GQSTNLNPRSQQFNWMDGYGASPAVQSPNTDPQTSSLITTIDVTAGRRRPFIAGILTVGKTYTISFRAKSDGGVISQVSSQLTGAVYPAVAPGEWKTYSFTGVAIGPAVDFQITGTSVSIAWIQVEELPFASPYIPTNGAAVTRAADAATLPQSLNLGESQVGFSLAVEFDSVNPGSYRVLELSDFSSILADGASIIIRHAGKEVYGINAPLGQRHHIAYSVATDGVITVALNGKVLATQSRSAGAVSSKTSISLGNRWNGDNNRAIYGHLRDLKIWTKKPLTADQLKVASA